MNITKLVLRIKSCTEQAQADVNALALHFKRTKPEQVRATLLPIVAKAYGVKLVAGSGKAEGTLVLDSEAKGYEACRKFLGRLVNAVTGVKPQAQSHARIGREARALAKAYLAEFESLSQAIAALKAVAK